MSSGPNVKELSFIYYFLLYHNSCNRCAIPDNDVDLDKAGIKVEDREETKEEDHDNLEGSEEDVNGINDDEEEDSPKKTKE